MSRSLILSEQFTASAPAVANAVREHREDRTALLASLNASWQGDGHIRAALLWGSFARGEADDLSDLDPWLIVADDAAPQMEVVLRGYAKQTGSLIFGSENTPAYAPPGGGYVSFLHEGRHGLLQVDCYWQPQSVPLPESEYAVVFDRQAEAYAGQQYPTAPLKDATGLDGEVERGLHFAWFMFSITAKSLARDASSDMGLMLYPKPGLEDAAARLGQAALLTPEDWVVPARPLEKVERLRHLIGKTEELRVIANAQGYGFSPAFTPCLFRYLELVQGILEQSASYGIN